MGDKPAQEGLGCILVVLAFLLLIVGLSVIDPLIEFINIWLKEHS